MNRYATQQRNRAIIARYKRGENVKQIAPTYGVTVRAVYHAFAKARLTATISAKRRRFKP